MRSRNIKLSGFTLVELSIVLVIIGLLIGGVLTGKNLIKAAELRSIITDTDKFIVAINGFREKYRAFPGDMTNATEFWGAAHATVATCKTTASTTIATCNGDGSGTITTAGTSSTYYEAFRAWQHLANAGFVEGKFTGTPGVAATIGTNVGVNAPASRLTGAGYTLYYLGTTSGDTNFFDDTYRHIITFGTASGSLNVPSYGGVITAADAFQIDTKLDDGKPGLGKVMVFKSDSPIAINCATTAVSTTAAYELSLDTSACNLIFKTGF